MAKFTLLPFGSPLKIAANGVATLAMEDKMSTMKRLLFASSDRCALDDKSHQLFDALLVF
jgi:hypothetical protein